MSAESVGSSDLDDQRSDWTGGEAGAKLCADILHHAWALADTFDLKLPLWALGHAREELGDDVPFTPTITRRARQILDEAAHTFALKIRQQWGHTPETLPTWAVERALVELGDHEDPQRGPSATLAAIRHRASVERRARERAAEAPAVR